MKQKPITKEEKKSIRQKLWEHSRPDDGTLSSCEFVSIFRLWKFLNRDLSDLPASWAKLIIRVRSARMGGEDPTKEKDFGMALVDALKDNGLALIKRLAQEMEKPTPTIEEFNSELGNLERLLSDMWDRSIPGFLPPLNTFSEPALWKWCCSVLKNANLSPACVKKTRQRLGLKPAKGKKVKLDTVVALVKSINSGQFRPL